MTSHARTALVTGSTSGIGFGIAELFASKRMNIVLHGLEPEGPDIARDLEQRFAVRCVCDAADLSTPTGVDALVAKARGVFGGVDVLVNNAGIQHVAPVESFPRERWQAVLDVNLTAPFLLAQAFWPYMSAQRWGRIINVASVHGLRASEYKAAYVAAKHALVGLTKVLALEGAAVGITANAICPGYVRTPLVAKQIEDQARHHQLTPEEVVTKVMLVKQPIKEFIPVAAVAETAWLLASDVSSATTGASFVLDGGWCSQ